MVYSCKIIKKVFGLSLILVLDLTCYLGVGVIGVIEADFLQPTHNKQDFDYTPNLDSQQRNQIYGCCKSDWLST